METGSPGKSTSKRKSSLPERRAHARHLVDAQADLVLVKSGSVLHGTILDLSLGGCRIRCHEKFPLGIYTRVETEFHLEGMPFRLAGVIQAIHSAYIVGVRFLDISPRKCSQIRQLIQEIEEMRTAPPAASVEAAGTQR